MKILMVASEAEPYSKTGGLADVMGALPAALAERGHDIGVVVPLYGQTKLTAPRVAIDSLKIPMGPEVLDARIVAEGSGRVTNYFVDYPAYYGREGLYGTPTSDYGDNAQRFMLLCRAAIEVARRDFRPDLFHCHEWQAGMTPVLLKTTYAGDPVVGSVPVLFTIHNLGYHGSFDPSTLTTIGLPAHLFRVDALEFYGGVNFLKGGIVFADALSTVSETYAREIQTPEHGHGLDGLLRSRRDVLTGILNGVDYSCWDPRADELIAARYSAENIDGKTICKKDLLDSCGLPADDLARPVLGVISRVTIQKGTDLIADAGDQLLAGNLSLIILGDGDPGYLQRLIAIQQRYPSKFSLTIGRHELLAHKIEAGADLFLMPSRYEPCGLNQLYSMRYGTAPVVRATGGLEDTVQEFHPPTDEGTGFKFHEHTVPAMMAALHRALEVYGDRGRWRRLMRNAMARDYSWKSSVLKYEALYESIVSRRPSH